GASFCWRIIFVAISMKCSCGAEFDVAENKRGTKTECPECGKELRVGGSETSMQSKRPPSRPVKPRDANGADDRDEPRSAKQPAGPKANLALLLGVGGCAVVVLVTCLVAGVGGVWFLTRSKLEAAQG